MRTVDDEHLMIVWRDGWVTYNEVTIGPKAYSNPEGQGGDKLELYGKPLDTSAATNPLNYGIVSPDDPSYAPSASAKATAPQKAFRRAKVTGSAWAWPDPTPTLEHVVFLKLPRKLNNGKRYRVHFAPGLNSDKDSGEFSFDIARSVSEAIHVNIVGYNPSHTQMKSADLYMWLGDGGARDYSSYAGRKVFLVNAKTGRTHEVGRVVFWKPSGPDFGEWNLTRSPVWTCDFSSFTGTGTYRLVVDGVGCSPDFELRRDAYFEPFKTSVRGFYYMRIGEPKQLTPVP
ncbi:MAG TPA: cellulase N-terminal Ig-like domain-containing protein, partial [Fimbriimonas sp.]